MRRTCSPLAFVVLFASCSHPSPAVRSPVAKESAPAPVSATAPEVVTTQVDPVVSMPSPVTQSLERAEAPTDDAGWQACGWGGGGYFWSCAFDPADADTIYLGGDVVGVYKSTDAGKRFRFINAGLSNYAAHSLAAAQSAPGTAYVLTKNGVCRTRDGGERWTALAATGGDGLGIQLHRPLSVRALAVDPMDADTVYAGGHTGGLWKSTDGGEQWTCLDYLASLAPEASEVPAFTGSGSLALTFKAERPDWGAHGRAEKFFGDGRDLSKYARITARVLVPKTAPKLQAQIAIQTGEKWLWQAGPYIDAALGTWTELAVDLGDMKDLASTRSLYIVLRSPHAGYSGRLFLDTVKLHPADGAADMLADWETPGDVAGWSYGKQYENTKLVTGIAQSQAAVGKVATAAISSVAIRSDDTSVLLVASNSHGLLRSENGGASWAQLDGPAKASCAAFAPSDGSIAYASFWEDKLSRSTDGGKTWTRCGESGLEAKSSIREVVVHPRDPKRVWCIGNIGWGGRVYYSTDGGDTWTGVNAYRRDRAANPTIPDENSGAPTSTMSSLTNIAVSPSNPDRLFMSANWACFLSDDGGQTWHERIAGADITCVTDIRFCGGTAYVTAMDEGLFSSDDRGASWKQLFPRKWGKTDSGHQWRALVQDVDGSRRIVSTLSPWDDNEHPYRMLVSNDGGSSFLNTYEGLPDYRTRPNTMWGQGYPRALAVDPVDSNTIYLGIDGDPEGEREGGGIFRSTDGGRSWSRLAAQPTSRRMFYALAIDPTDSKRIYWGACGDNGGLHRSDDGGESWERIFDKETWVFNLEVAPSGAVFVPGKNLWRSPDGGTNWKQLTSFSDGATVLGLAIDPEDEGRIWISRVTWGDDAKGGLYRTTDGGATWEEITADIPYTKPLVLRYDAEQRELWAGGAGLFRLKQ